jgi:MraZ protein
MASFLSTYLNKVDKKGRVSVPASFRAVLAAEAGGPDLVGGAAASGVVVFRSLHQPALEACSPQHLELLSRSMDSLDLPAEEYELIEATIFGGSVVLPFDGEGRIILPEPMLADLAINEQVAFVGRRRTFQIWQPEALASYEATLRASAKAQDISLSKIIARTQTALLNKGGTP